MKATTGKSRRLLDQHLNAYVLAAGAAAVLALPQQAQAEIIYTPTDQRLTGVGFLLIDLNHDGTNDFQLENELSLNTSSYLRNVFAAGSQRGNGLVNEPGAILAVALPRGARIGSSGNFSLVGVLAGRFHVDAGGEGSYGEWQNVASRYLGLKFEVSGQTHFGWARLTVKLLPGSGLGIATRLTGYAYETLPNTAIRAGDTGSSETAGSSAPLAGSLGALARGAAR